MVRRRRRRSGGDHEEHADERWLLTYADLITLLMALFMVLFSMSVVNKSKLESLKASLHNAFSPHVLPGGQSIKQTGGDAQIRNVQPEVRLNRTTSPATPSPRPAGPTSIRPPPTRPSRAARAIAACRSSCRAAVHEPKVQSPMKKKLMIVLPVLLIVLGGVYKFVLAKPPVVPKPKVDGQVY